MDREFQKGGQFSAMEMANKMQQQLEQASSVHSLNNMLKRVKDLNLEGNLAGLISTEDTLKKYLQSSPYNSILDNATNSVMQQLSNIITENNAVFKDTVTALSLTRAFETALSSYKASTQIISPVGFANESQISELSSVMSNATEALTQFRSLTSLKALSSLKNFPFEDVFPTDFTESIEFGHSSKESMAELDAQIIDELGLEENFDKISEDKQKFIISKYQNLYFSIVFNYLVIISWWEVVLKEKMDLANKTFIFVRGTEQPLSYVRKQIDFASLKNNLLACAIYDILKHFFLG